MLALAEDRWIMWDARHIGRGRYYCKGTRLASPRKAQALKMPRVFVEKRVKCWGFLGHNNVATHVTSL